MHVCIFMLVFIFVSGREAKEDFPLLNAGDVRPENLTDSSVVLTWTLRDHPKTNISDNLRLVVHMETDGKPPIYMTPARDDKECSISISKCLLTFLTHNTKYKMIVSIDDVNASTLLGYATVEFTTHSLEDHDRLLKKILLYVVLPAVVGFVIIVVTLVIVCARCCRCLCWRKPPALSPQTSHRQDSLEVTSQQEVRVSNYYDEAYEVSMSRQDSGRYLSLITAQQPAHPDRPAHQFEMERELSTNTSSSRGTRLYLDTIIAQEMAQQQLQHRSPPLHPPTQHRPKPLHNLRRPAAGPIIDNDGYLDVIDPSESEHYANGLNML